MFHSFSMLNSSLEMENHHSSSMEISAPLILVYSIHYGIQYGMDTGLNIPSRICNKQLIIFIVDIPSFSQKILSMFYFQSDHCCMIKVDSLHRALKRGEPGRVDVFRTTELSIQSLFYL